MAQKANTGQQKDFISAIGRRREAVARIRLYSTVKDDLMWKETPIKKGEIFVNQLPIASYFSSEVMKYQYTEPFRITNTQNKFTLTIRVVGGGKAGQLDAVIAGVSNALCKLDADAYRSILKKHGFLTRDSRVRERRKVGTGGKARRKKQSPKR